jgi:SAM-dependent MidA family methyltransferase
VLDAAPACSGALRYVCVERSAALRTEADGLLPTEPAANVFGAVIGGDLDEERSVPGTGPVVAVLDDLPLVPVTGVVLANELLDNLPFRLLERTAAGWSEVFVALDGSGLGELLVEASPECAEEASRLAPSASVGARIPLQHEAVAWLRRACETLLRGRVLLIDYADATPSLASRAWTEWVRTYRGHAPGGHPLAAPGEQDITCEVAVDQLARFRAPTSDSPQSAWLARHGIEALRAEASSRWTERAHIGDLEALRWRSRVGEVDALVDPSGLGAFRVLEWEL